VAGAGPAAWVLAIYAGAGAGELFQRSGFSRLLAQSPEQNPTAAIQLWGQFVFEYDAHLEGHWVFGPAHACSIILKGILHSNDAALSAGCRCGCAYRFESRRAASDGAIGALDALPGVVREVNGRVPVLFDSGFVAGRMFSRRSRSAQEPCSSGACICGVWRWRVKKGCGDVLLNLAADLDLTMALSGYTCCRELDSSALCRSDSAEPMRQPRL